MEHCLELVRFATDLGNAAFVHSLPVGAGIWPPAFPPRSPRGVQSTSIAGIVLALAGCAFPPRSPRGKHYTAIAGIVLALAGCAFPPRSPRGPLQHKTGCWRTLFFVSPSALMQAELATVVGGYKKTG